MDHLDDPDLLNAILSLNVFNRFIILLNLRAGRSIMYPIGNGSLFTHIYAKKSAFEVYNHPFTFLSTIDTVSSKISLLYHLVSYLVFISRFIPRGLHITSIPDSCVFLFSNVSNGMIFIDCFFNPFSKINSVADIATLGTHFSPFERLLSQSLDSMIHSPTWSIFLFVFG